MSEPGLSADVALNIQAALSQVGDLEAALSAAVEGLVVQVDASNVGTTISDAVAGADALVAVDADATQVTPEIDAAVAGADATVPIDADTTQAEAGLTGIQDEASNLDATMPVDADTSAAERAIHDVAAEADATDATVQVGADTGDAEQAITSLGDAADTAGGQTERLEGGLKGLEGASGVAEGSAAGLGVAIGSVSKEAAIGVGAVGALAGAAAGFFEKGVEAQGAAFRLDQTFGSLADKVTHIHVGDLSGEIGDLGVKLGTTTASMEAAAADIGVLGTSAGVATPQVAETTSQIEALALRAVALKPALGDAGDVTDRLVSGLSRGGKFLAQYGISLTAAQIQQEALTETQKSSVAELTVYDKAAAGAALATQDLGKHLREDIAEGAKNPQIQLAAIKATFQEFAENLGKPLVSPVLSLLIDLEHTAEPVAQALGDVLQAVIPVADVLASVLAPPLQLVDDVLKHIPPELIEVAGGLALAAEGVAGLAVALLGLSESNPVLAALEVAVGAVAVGVGVFRSLTGQSGADAFAAQVKKETAALTDQDGQLRITTKSLGDYIKSTDGFEGGKFAKTLDQLHISTQTVTDGILKGKSANDLFTGSEQNLGAALRESGGVYDQHVQKILKNDAAVENAKGAYTALVKSTQAAAQATLLAAEADGSITKSQLDAALAADNHAAALHRLQPEIDAHNSAITEATALYGPLIDQQAAVTSGLQALAIDSTSAHDAVVDLASSGVAPTDATLLEFATTMDHAHLSTSAMGESAAALGVSTDQLSGFISDATGVLDDFVKKAVDGLPSVDAAFKGAKSIQGFIDNLNSGRDKTQQFMSDLQAIFDAGGHAIAGALAEQGLEGGAGYARTLAASLQTGDVKLVSNAEEAVDLHNRAISKATAFLTTTFGPEYIATTGQIAALAADAFNSNLDFATRTRLATQLAGAALSTEGQAIATIAANKGRDAAEAYGALFKIDAKTVAAGEAAAAAFLASGAMPQAGSTTGSDTATALAQSLSDSLGSDLPGALASGGAAVTGGSGPVTAAGGAVGSATSTALAQQLADSLGSDVPGAMDAAGHAISAAGSGPVAGAARTAGVTAADAWHTGFGGLLGHTTSSLHDAAAVITGAEPGLSAAGKNTGDKSGQSLGRQFGSSVTQSIGKGMQDAAAHDAINSAAANVTRYTGDRLNDDADGVGRRAGEEITAGLAAGMQDGASHGALNSAAHNVVAYAEARVRAEAQSHSPSLLFAEIGKDLSAGLALGITAGGPDVAAAATAAVQSAVAEAEAIVQQAFTAIRGSVAVANTGGIGAGGLSAIQNDVTSALAGVGAQVGQILVDARGMVFPGVTTAAQAEAVGSAFMSGAVETLRMSRQLQVALKMQGGG